MCRISLKKHYSIDYVSKQKGANKINIRDWVCFYEQYGKSGLLPRQNQSYAVNFKLKVLQAIGKEYLSLREACFYNLISLRIQFFCGRLKSEFFV